MRLKRHKKQDKFFKFYAARFGYRLPLRIIVDSSFLRSVVEFGRGKSLEVLFSQVFGQRQVRLVVTPCIMKAISRRIKESDKELLQRDDQARSAEHGVAQREVDARRRTPDWWRRTSWLARKLELVPCRHSKSHPNSDSQDETEGRCIEACVERGPDAAQQAGLSRSRGRFAVATADDVLRTRLGAIVGAMILRLTFISGGMHVRIEPPSVECLQIASDHDQRYFSATAAELEAAREAEQALRLRPSRDPTLRDDNTGKQRESIGLNTRLAPAPEPRKTSNEVDTVIAPTKARRRRRLSENGKVPWMDAKTNVADAFKRKRARGPNPLSQRKSKKKR